jgi:hypothetical protein
VLLPARNRQVNQAVQQSAGRRQAAILRQAGNNAATTLHYEYLKERSGSNSWSAKVKVDGDGHAMGPREAGTITAYVDGEAIAGVESRWQSRVGVIFDIRVPVRRGLNILTFVYTSDNNPNNSQVHEVLLYNGPMWG